MNYLPKGERSCEEVDEALLTPTHWRLEYGEGFSVEPVEGFGTQLPDGVLSRVPSRAKRRKIERGLEQDKTSIFASLVRRDGQTRLDLFEGRITVSLAARPADVE